MDAFFPLAGVDESGVQSPGRTESRNALGASSDCVTAMGGDVGIEERLRYGRTDREEATRPGEPIPDS